MRWSCFFGILILGNEFRTRREVVVGVRVVRFMVGFNSLGRLTINVSTLELGFSRCSPFSILLGIRF